MITFCSSVKSVEFVDWTSFCNCLARLKKKRKRGEKKTGALTLCSQTCEVGQLCAFAPPGVREKKDVKSYVLY